MNNLKNDYTKYFYAKYNALNTKGPLGAEFKNNQTTKQLNNFIWTNRNQVKFCFYLPIGPNRIVQLFSCLIVF